MKARKLNLEDYSTGAKTTDGKDQNVGVVDSLCGLITHPELLLTGRELIKASALCEKIEAADGEILLDEKDYALVTNACESIKGLPRVFVKLLERVFDTKEVEVEESS